LKHIVGHHLAGSGSRAFTGAWIETVNIPHPAKPEPKASV